VNKAAGIKGMKKELSGDEKVLESAFKLEVYYKKYKLIIWAVVIALILFFVGRSVMASMEETRLIEANKALLVLQITADDADALATLEEKNPALFELFSYSQASKNADMKTLEALSGSTNEIIADASRYTAGVLNKKPVDSKLYKELALFQEAYLAIGTGDTQAAKDKLGLIDERSPLGKIAGFLKHSVIKAK
jgi:hypothetical protein